MIRVTREIKCLIDHKYIWFRVGISVTFFKNRFPSEVGLSPGDKKC
jgi:hypothetical protein